MAKEPLRCAEQKRLEANESHLGVCWLILKLEEGGVLLDTHWRVSSTQTAEAVGHTGESWREG